MAIIALKGYLLFITFSDFYLIIGPGKIKLGKTLSLAKPIQ